MARTKQEWASRAMTLLKNPLSEISNDLKTKVEFARVCPLCFPPTHDAVSLLNLVLLIMSRSLRFLY